MSGFKNMMEGMKKNVKEDAFAAVQGCYLMKKDATGEPLVAVIDGLEIDGKIAVYDMAMYSMDADLYAENKPCWACIGRNQGALGIGGRDYEAITTAEDAIDTIIYGVMVAGLKAQGMRVVDVEKMSDSEVELFNKLIIRQRCDCQTCDMYDDDDDEFDEDDE